MRICSINSYNCNTPKRTLSAPKPQSAVQNNVNFTGEDNRKSSLSKTKGAVIGLCLLPLASGIVTSCDEEPVYANAQVGVEKGDSIQHSDTIVDRWEHTDTIKNWRNNFQRPIPLDSLFKNFGNWGFVDGDMNDPKSNRNIIHYDITREWEENDREIGDMNYLQSARDKNVLVYDTEIKDYKGNHKYYGKSVIRIPDESYTVTTKDGSVLRSPKGFFVESWRSNSDRKGADFTSCTPLTRDFCVTVGDSLRVAKQTGNNEFQLTGSVGKGYLDDKSILLKNLIGIYSTDDHLRNVEIKAVNDEALKDNYVEAMKEYRKNNSNY